jgi:PAS domain S-box-containing protein
MTTQAGQGGREAASPRDKARLVATTPGAAAARDAETARLLVETARHLGETLDPESVYDRFHELLADTVPHDGVLVSSYDPEEDLIRCEYVWTDGRKLDPAALPPLKPNPSGEGMQTTVIRSGETLLANDVEERVAASGGTYYNVDGEGNVRKIPETGPAGTRAAILAPVKHEGEVVGIVQLMSDRHRFTLEDADLVGALVSQMAAAVRNAKLYTAAQAELAARTRAERELRESEARLRATFENAAVGIAHVGLDGAWLRVNDRLCEILGYERGELVRRTAQSVTHPDDLEDDALRSRSLQAGDIDNYVAELRYVRKDGTPVWVSVSWSLLADETGSPLQLIAVVEDIDRRKQAEAERRRLEASEQAARAVAREREQAARVLAALDEGVVLVDDDGIVRLWNPAAERILRVARKDVVGSRLADVLPEWRFVTGRAADEGMREMLPITAGGRELWLSMIAVRSADGIVYAFRDETAERALERAKSDFVATVSHELRTPLAGIYGAAVTLGRDDVRFTDDQRRRLLSIVTAEADRLAHIVDEILVTAELESGRIRLNEEYVDLAAAAETVVAAARARLEERRITLATSPDAPAVVGDDQKIRQVLTNLLDNAIKYAPRAAIDVEVCVSSGCVVARVRDTGPGIPASEQERIFEKFYRLDPHLTSGVSGSGLGLYICRELVERMGGRLRVESAEGKGATFTVALPPAAPARAVDAAAL